MAKFDELSASKQKALLLLTQQIIDPEAKRLTYGEIADQCGVDHKTLWRWRTQDADFASARKELVDSYANETVADAFAALNYQIRKKRNVKAIELLLKSRGMLIDRREVNAEMKHEINDVSAKDNAALLEELDALRAKLAEE